MGNGFFFIYKCHFSVILKKNHILQNEKKIGDIMKIFFLQFWGIFIFLLVIKDIVSMTENSAF